MNISNNLTETGLASKIAWVSDSIGLYGIPYSAATGLTFKLFMIVILSSQKLTNDFYKYLRVKTVFDILANNVVNNNSFKILFESYENNYWTVFGSSYIVLPFMRIFMLSTFFCDIYLTYNRLSVFVTQLKFKNIHWITLAMVSFAFSLALVTPFFFLVNIRPTNESGLWTFGIRTFGMSNLFLIYGFLLVFFETIIPLALIVYLNCVLAYKYHQYQRRRSSLVLTSTQSATVKIIVIKTTLIIIVDLLETVALTLVRVSLTETSEFDELMRQSIKLFRNFVSLLYFINQSIDVFISVFYDKNILNVLTEWKIYKKVGLNLFLNQLSFISF